VPISVPNDDEDTPLLTEEMKAALLNSTWVKAALADSTLQSLLTDIDKHPDRAKKLLECKQRYPDFEGFLDRLLMEVGALKYEDGRLVFVA
jgi:hypothetical protein